MVRPSEGPEGGVLERGRMPREIENDLLRGKVDIYMTYRVVTLTTDRLLGDHIRNDDCMRIVRSSSRIYRIRLDHLSDIGCARRLT